MTEPPKKRGRPPGSKSGPNPLEVQKHTLFERALNRHARKSIKKLKETLKSIEELSALEVMAIRTLLRAAERADHRSVTLVLGKPTGEFLAKTKKKGRGKPEPEPPPDLPEVDELDA